MSEALSVVSRASNEPHAILIKNYLGMHGIEAYVRFYHSPGGWTFTHVHKIVEVYVKSSELEEAKNALDQMRISDDNRDIENIDKSGEGNEFNIETDKNGIDIIKCKLCNSDTIEEPRIPKVIYLILYILFIIFSFGAGILLIPHLFNKSKKRYLCQDCGYEIKL